MLVRRSPALLTAVQRALVSVEMSRCLSWRLRRSAASWRTRQGLAAAAAAAGLLPSGHLLLPVGEIATALESDALEFHVVHSLHWNCTDAIVAAGRLLSTGAPIHGIPGALDRNMHLLNDHCGR